MIDTHTHLYTSDAFADAEGADAVCRALDAGVRLMVFPNIDASTVGPMLELHRKFPEQTLVGMALHPTEIGDDWRDVMADMERRISAGGYSAIGETGIDLYWDASRREEQMEAFSIHYDWAVRYGLPLIIHCREGLDETLEVIASKNASERPKMIFHSFTSGPDDVKRIRKVCDAWFGINGVVTFKNARGLREALPEIGLQRLVLETDSPYLAPVPHRGKRNESSYLPLILAEVARTLGISEAEAEAATDRNALEIFLPCR